jgi:hypothetical protein
MMLWMSVVGTLVGAWASKNVGQAFWQVAVDLVVMSVIQIIMDFLSNAHGTPIPNNWPVRMAGIAVFMVTALQLTGHLV